MTNHCGSPFSCVRVAGRCRRPTVQPNSIMQHRSNRSLSLLPLPFSCLHCRTLSPFSPPFHRVHDSLPCLHFFLRRSCPPDCCCYNVKRGHSFDSFDEFRFLYLASLAADTRRRRRRRCHSRWTVRLLTDSLELGPTDLSSKKWPSSASHEAERSPSMMLFAHEAHHETV